MSFKIFLELILLIFLLNGEYNKIKILLVYTRVFKYECNHISYDKMLYLPENIYLSYLNWHQRYNSTHYITRVADAYLKCENGKVQESIQSSTKKAVLIY